MIHLCAVRVKIPVQQDCSKRRKRQVYTPCRVQTGATDRGWRCSEKFLEGPPGMSHNDGK
jgi:hypothetical protein